jgi:hypothetical protein
MGDSWRSGEGHEDWMHELAKRKDLSGREKKGDGGVTKHTHNKYSL